MVPRTFLVYISCGSQGQSDHVIHVSWGILCASLHSTYQSTIRISSPKHSSLLPPSPESLFERLKTLIESGLPSNVTSTGYLQVNIKMRKLYCIIYTVFLSYIVTLYLISIQYFWAEVAILDRITNDYFNLSFSEYANVPVGIESIQRSMPQVPQR